MRSTFSGLDIAYRALQAQQQAIEVINHNVANANTRGYSRQSVELAATLPYSLPALNRDGYPGQMGTGVEVVQVRRARYSFIDSQIRAESQTQGRWEKMNDALQQVEVVLNEPSDSGLNSLLSKFWQSWQDVANNPQDAGARSALAELADSLSVAINRKYSQLTSIQQDFDRQIKLSVDKVNQLSEEIASLNARIAEIEIGGQHANDLRDQRDLLLDDLSKLVKVTYYDGRQGAVNVFLGSRALVIETTTQTLSTALAGNGFSSVVWESDGSASSITDGELYGLQQARDVELPRFIGDATSGLDALAATLISSVNALHITGYGLDNTTGLDFFTGTGAEDIAVSATLLAQPEKIATAGSPDSKGDNSISLAIAGLQRDWTMNGGTADFGNFLASMVSRLGVDAQKSRMMSDNQNLLVDHLTRQRDSVSGVSLDEESTQLIQYQRAYQAASRVVNAVDEMLDRLINGTGLVGR